MKLVSLNEWCSLGEAKKGPVGPLEPVPQELKDLCVVPDEASRLIAAYQLPNYDPADPFFKEWGEYLARVNDKKIKTIGERILKWTQGGRVDIKKAFSEALNQAVQCDDKIYIFSSDKKLTPELIAANVSDGHFVKQFGDCYTNFICTSLKLKSLKNSPSKVGGYFDCSDNELTSLEGGPSIIGTSYLCYKNKLTNLVGAPAEINGHFTCDKNPLKSLEGAPRRIHGQGFFCRWTPLTSLEGGPEFVKETYNCSFNALETLEGAPQEPVNYFYASDNMLKDFKGMPPEIRGNFYADKNSIRDFTGFTKVGGDFICMHNTPRLNTEIIESIKSKVSGTITWY